MSNYDTTFSIMLKLLLITLSKHIVVIKLDLETFQR